MELVSTELLERNGTRRINEGRRGEPRALILSPIPTHPPHEGNRERALQMAEAVKSLGVKEQFFCHVRVPAIDCPSGDNEMARYWGSSFAALDTAWIRRNGNFHVSRRTKWLGYLTKAAGQVGFDAAFLERFRSANAWFPNGLGRWIQKFAVAWHPTIALMEYPFLSKAFDYLPGGVWKVIDAQDVFTQRNERLKASGITANWLSLTRSQEARLLCRADRVVAIQEEEAAFFGELLPPHKVATVSALSEPIRVCPPSDAGEVIGLLGSANAANLAGAEWFFAEVFPRLKQCCPGVRLRVAALWASIFPRSMAWRSWAALQTGKGSTPGAA